MKIGSTAEDFNNFLIYLGEWIKSKRENKEFTQEQISELTGIEYKYYQKIESGKANITIKTFYKICAALEIDPGQFLM